MATSIKVYKQCRLLLHHSHRFASSSPIITSSQNKIVVSNHHEQYHHTHQQFSNKPEFPDGRFSPPGASSGEMKRPSIRIGGGGISLGPEFEPELEGLPWEPQDIHPERPPPGYMCIDGFFDGNIQVDGKKYKHSVLIMPQFVVKWKANKMEDVTPEHFAMPTIHYPAIRHIFVGCGYTMPCPTPPEWIDYLNKYRVTVEICALATAARLFNMQNTLFQNFACALIYEKDVVERFHSLVRKIDLDMDDPHSSASNGPRESYYYGTGKKWD